MSTRVKSLGLLTTAGILGGFVAVLVVGLMSVPVKGEERCEVTPAVQTEAVASAQALSDAYAQVAEKASPAVVFIEVEKERV